MKRWIIIFSQLGVLGGLVCTLGGCVTTTYSLDPPPPYMLLPVDEMMTCDAVASSFWYSAKRAALLEYWMSVGPLEGYGYDEFPQDAPKQLVDERRRLDALTDLQREKGCRVIEPGPAVVYERSKLEKLGKGTTVILNSRG